MNETHINISDLKEGLTVHGTYIIDNICPKVTKAGNNFFFAEVKDASGKMNAVCWEPDGVITAAQNGEIVDIIGTISSYNDQLQFSIESAEIADPAAVDEDLLNTLVPSAPIDLDAYKQTVASLVDSIQDEDIREICVFELFYKRGQEFLTYPAAKTVHHACRHGLLMHSVDMARMGDCLAKLKPGTFNRDLMIAGTLLHDIGKVVEFEVSPVTGLVTDYSVIGKLYGHAVLGVQEIEDAAAIVGARPEVVQLLSHMVLAHHGDPSCGAAKEPAFIEAELLHDLDLLDSRRQIYEENLSLTPKGEFSPKVFSLGRAIYNHQLAATAVKQKEV